MHDIILGWHFVMLNASSNHSWEKSLCLMEGEQHGEDAAVMEPRMKKKSVYMPANFTVANLISMCPVQHSC